MFHGDFSLLMKYRRVNISDYKKFRYSNFRTLKCMRFFAFNLVFWSDSRVFCKCHVISTTVADNVKLKSFVISSACGQALKKEEKGKRTIFQLFAFFPFTGYELIHGQG